VLDGHITEIVSFYNAHAADRTASLWRPIRSESARLSTSRRACWRCDGRRPGLPASLLFDAVNEAVADMVDADVAMLFRFERDDGISLLASRGARSDGPWTTCFMGFATRPPRWLESEGGDSLRSTVVVPITIAGTVWGASVAAWRRPDRS
jgi:hypothetical protein